MSIVAKDDLPESIGSNELIDVMVDGVNAKALRVAPCLGADASTEALAEARLILVGALRRWVEAGSGALSQHSQTAGPFVTSDTYDTRQRTGFNLWPSEIASLQALCSDGASGKAFTVDMTGWPVAFNPLSGAVINTAEGGPTPVGSWSEDRQDYP